MYVEPGGIVNVFMIGVLAGIWIAVIADWLGTLFGCWLARYMEKRNERTD